jgi:hypothetical protein
MSTRIKFTTRTLDSLKPPAKGSQPDRYWNTDPLRRRMLLKVYATGRKTACIDMVPAGKKHSQLIEIGEYPQDPLAALNAAYDAKLHHAKDDDAGRPPHILEAFWDPEKRAPLLDKIIAAQMAYMKPVAVLPGDGMLFEDAVEEYVQKRVLHKIGGLRPAYAKVVITTLRKLAPWKVRLLASITEAEVNAFIRDLHDNGRGGAGSTRRLLALVSNGLDQLPGVFSRGVTQCVVAALLAEGSRASAGATFAPIAPSMSCRA